MYQKADLIIDQLHIGSYGLFAVESMAMGKPVICWISDFMKDHYPSELPLIRANPANITEVIESVLKNRDMLPEIGQKGRKYAEVHHDMVKNSKKTLAVYQSLLSE
ncbi:glycosyltransferase [Bacillus licheniformis]|nr:glycosyltransferase [Bacillus licheniformis]